MVKSVYWYRVIDLGNGIVTNGDYDLRPLIPRYGIPEDLTGKDVLDVGRGSGFFSFEFEKRGERAVATDLPSFFDWDFVGGAPTRRERERMASVPDQKAHDPRWSYGAFDLAHEILNSKVQSVFINVYNMSPEALDGKTFDIVFVGGLLSDLKDPILALEKLYSVTKEGLIIASPITETASSVPTMHLNRDR